MTTDITVLEARPITSWEQDVENGKLELRDVAFHAIAAGRHFKEAKEKHRALFGKTGWEHAIQLRGVGVKTADTMIHVYETFGGIHEIDFANISSTVLLRLAAPSVPEEARVKVIEIAEAGEKVTVKETERIIAAAKEEARREQREHDNKHYARQQQELTQATTRINNMQATQDLLAKERREALAELNQARLKLNAGPSLKHQEELDEAKRNLNRTRLRADNLDAELKKLRDEKIKLEQVRQPVVEVVDVHRVLSGLVNSVLSVLGNFNAEVQKLDVNELDSTDGFRIGQVGRALEDTLEALDVLRPSRVFNRSSDIQLTTDDYMTTTTRSTSGGAEAGGEPVEDASLLLSIAERVDDMDDSGDVADKKSPAQARRKAQLPVIQRIYDVMYPDDFPISKGTAAKWISMCDNSAATVLEFMQENQRMKPDSNSRKMFITNAMTKRKRRELAPLPALPSVAHSDPFNEPAPKHFDGELKEPDAEFWAKQKRAEEALKRQGEVWYSIEERG